MPNPLAGSDHSSFPHTPITGSLPPLLPTPGKSWFPGSPDLVAAKSPLTGERLGPSAAGQCSPAGLQGSSSFLASMRIFPRK